MHDPRDRDTLATYPYVVVRIGCDRCPRRKGQYRLARLAQRFGAETPLDQVLREVAADCPWWEPESRRGPSQYVPKCAARFVDLDPPPRLADLPPGMLGLRVFGGR